MRCPASGGKTPVANRTLHEPRHERGSKHQQRQKGEHGAHANQSDLETIQK